MKNKLLSFLPLTIVIVVSMFTILPLFHSGFFPMHDNTQVQRVYEMYKSLKDGMFPVRWVDDLGYGYGYPLFNFYGPFAYYIGALFVFILSDSLIATKIMIGLAMLGSSMTMYFLAKSLWGKWGGVVSALLYLFAPYHAVDIYVRGDIGELWAYVFFPLALLGVWRIYKKPSIVSMSIGAVGMAGIILSHNLSAFLFTPFLLASIVIAAIASLRAGQGKKVYVYGGLFMFGVLLSLFYSLPVLSEMKYTNVLSQVGGSADFHNHFVCLAQLWQSQWGFGGSAAGCVDGLSFMVGKMHLILSLAGLLLLPFLWKKKELFLVGIFCLAGLAVSILLMLPLSSWLWALVHQMAFLQYPWRYLLLASLFSSLVSGMIISFALEKQKILGMGICIVVVVVTVLFNLKYFQPQTYVAVESGSYTSHYALEWTASKISDEYMPQSFVKPKRSDEIPQSLIVPSSAILVQKEEGRTQEKTVRISVKNAQEVFLNLAYFPGWKVFDNNAETSLQPTTKGTKVYLSEGSHTLKLLYTGTLSENMSNTISLTSAIILILAIIWEIGKTYERKSS